VLNIESKRALPDGAEHLIRPLASALAPLAEDVCAGGALELPALARLFVHFGSIRDPDEIAALAAASLPRRLPLEVSQVVVWNELGSPVELASWSRDATTQLPLTSAADGLTDAGFPLRISAGISTYPFDGASTSALLRAADQALYAAKNGGKDRIASFRDVIRSGPPAISTPSGAAVNDSARRGRGEDRFLPMWWLLPRRSKPRRRSKAFAGASASHSSSSWGLRHAPPPGS